MNVDSAYSATAAASLEAAYAVRAAKKTIEVAEAQGAAALHLIRSAVITDSAVGANLDTSA